MRDISLYFHIPFCNSKCYYCDFDSEMVGRDYKKRYIDALIKEIDISYKNYKLENKKVESIYIGGGTPTSLPYDILEMLLKKIEEKFINSSNIPEYTIEMNPNSIDEEKIRILKKYKINRVSVGAQSVNQNELDILGRTHTFTDLKKTIKILRKYGFFNINVDLMFGIPNQTMESFIFTLNSILAQKITHISIYGLILEEGTKYYDLYKKGLINFSDDDEYVKMYEYLTDSLSQNEFKKYEISNFSKKNYECIHNIRYWESKEYIGFGRSAYSFYENKRFYNEKVSYIEKLNKGILPISNDIEYVDKNSLLDEWIMLRFRMTKGINIKKFNERFKIDFLKKYKDIIRKNIDLNNIMYDGENIYLTTQGFEISNKIILEFVSI